MNSFEDLKLDDRLLRGVYELGFENPSIIQQQAISPIIDGKDIIAQAQSGTGKTATFSIALIQKIIKGGTKVIVLCPTRELAKQTSKVIEDLGHYTGIKIHLCIGGTSVRDDVKILTRGVDVVIGTPGRIYDMLNRVEVIRKSTLLIIDEADEMLSVGFKEQIHSIFKMLSENIQVALFSATLPPEIVEITKKFMRDPECIYIKRGELTLEGIKQFYIFVEKEEWKFKTLCDLYESLSINKAIIFCNTCRKVEWLTKKLLENNFTVSHIHGDMEQDKRTDIINKFKNGTDRILITTDLLARGIDIQHVSLVINYDFPSNNENYIHRIGRSGRYGRKGVAINFVLTKDINSLKSIENFYETQIDEMPGDVSNYM